MIVSNRVGSRISPAATLIKRSRQILTQILEILETHRQLKDCISRKFPVSPWRFACKAATRRHKIIGSQPTYKTAVLAWLNSVISGLKFGDHLKHPIRLVVHLKKAFWKCS